MKLIVCEAPPHKRGYMQRNCLMQIIEEFLSMDVPCVRIDNPPGHYTSENGFYKGLKNCVKCKKYPVEVFTHDYKVYLQRITAATSGTEL